MARYSTWKYKGIKEIKQKRERERREEIITKEIPWFVSIQEKQKKANAEKT